MEAVDALKRMLDISTIEVYKYYQTFRQFDRDDSGELDISELKQVFSILGVKVHEESIKLLLAGIDEDGSGEVDFKEFLQMMVTQKKKLDQDEELEEAFKVFVLSRLAADDFYGMDGFENGFENGADLVAAQVVTAKVLLYQLRAAGLVDDKVDDPEQQEELVKVMLAVANRFAPLAERQGQRSNFDVAADRDSEMSIAFSAGAAVGARRSISPPVGGSFENPMRDSVMGADGQTEQAAATAVGYFAYRAMMVAVADPSVDAVDAARLNDLGEKIRLMEQVAAEVDEGFGPVRPQRSRVATTF